MDKVLGGVASMNRVPAALFLVDIMHENIALKEAQRLNINTFGIVDTNSDPTRVDFAIPGNDDAATSIAILTNYIADAIAEGLAERAASQEGMDQDEEDNNDDNRFDDNFGDDEVTEKDGKPKDGAARGKKRTGTGGGGQGRARTKGPARKV